MATGKKPPATDATDPAKGKSPATGKTAAAARHGRRRIRLLILILTLLVIPPGVLVNLGPYREYAEAREKLRDKEQEVALVEQEIASLEEEMGRLGKDTYVEALARKELAYARPGEEVFIVKGLPEAAADEDAAQPAAEETPGSIETLVKALRALLP